MKIIFSWILVFCLLFMSACGSSGTITLTTLPGTEPPSQTDAVQETDSAEASPEVVMVPFDLSDMNSYYITAAEKCRTVVDGYEYYFDTSKPVVEEDLENENPFPDFPLMKKKTGDTEGVFIGLYGNEFKVNNDYMYVNGGYIGSGDYASWTTRALSLKDGSVSEELYSVDLYFPPEGNQVFYYESPGSTIYCCNPDLTVIDEYPIHLPDIDDILDKLKTMGYDDISIGYGGITEDYFEYYINQMEIKDRWIYFSYEMCEPPQLTAYKGNYRMSLDGTKIESTGEGTYSERSDYWGDEDYADD